MGNIGAESVYEECAYPPYDLFKNMGDVGFLDHCAMYT